MHNDIILYTIDCPKCQVLKAKLDAKNIKYYSCMDTNLIKSKGIELLPVLEVNGQLMSFMEAVKWINEQ